MLYLFLFVIFISIFIVGMFFLRTGLYHLAADSLKKWLVVLTDTHWKGLIAGTIVTGILQSSSAVMVLTVGFISAKILTFRRSIGIILGTNIGTTFTTEFITFDIDTLLVPMAFIGAIFLLIDRLKMKSVGFIFLGLASIFTGMNGFEYLATPISTIPAIQDYMTSLDQNAFLSLITGTIFTGIIQSSTAAIGMMMGFLGENVFQLQTGIAFMLGANIGTCVTGYIASIGSGKESKLCAYAHIWLNILGVLCFYPLIDQLANSVSLLSSRPEVQLAHSSVTFNVITSLLVLPFANHFATFIEKVHKKA